MDLGSIFILFALVIVTVFYILWPLYEKGQAKTASCLPADLAALESERARILYDLRDLDELFNEEKIEAADYHDQRTALLSRGAEVLQRIEARAPHLQAEDQAEPIASEMGADLMNDPLEAAIGERRRIRKDRGAGFCPVCGSPLQKSDRFCWKCGTKTGFIRTP